MAAPPFATLDAALGWLDGHIDFELTTPTSRSLPSLTRMLELAEILDHPERAVPSIHITGTNGKGSTAAMTTALLGAMGLTVGTYSSPNLSRVNERLARNGEPIDDDSFTELLSSLAILEPLLTEPATRFELLTAAAFRWFADEAVDAMVIEVGLGGSWDCTNIVEANVSVITNISYDHTEVLGPTLEGIAKDKSGIIKAGTGVVIGERRSDLVDIMRESARAVGAGEVWVIGEEFECEANRLAVGGRLLDLRTPGGRYSDVLVPLHGPHQGSNAACALAAAEAFFGSALAEDVVDEGFGAARIDGRLEVVGRFPLTLIDGAHNVAGAEALSRSLIEEFSVEGAAIAVVGMLTGRDPLAMLAPLQKAGVTTIVGCIPNSPRAMAIELIGEAAEALGLRFIAGTDVADALRIARSLVETDGLLVVTGSLYLVGDARTILFEDFTPR